MEFSRVSKFKDYRDSFTKENSVSFDTKKSNEYLSTTNTLPYKEVIPELESEQKKEEAIKKDRFKRIYLMALFILIGLGITIGLVFLGILAFRG